MKNPVARWTKNSQGEFDVEILDESALNPGDIYGYFTGFYLEQSLHKKTDTGSVVCEESDIPIV